MKHTANSETFKQHHGSFRDPSGFIFMREGKLYRQVNTLYSLHYDHLMNSGLYERLIKAKWLIAHTEQEPVMASGNAYKILYPTVVPFISYPYEWSFSQLKDAALRTLDIQMLAMDYGMTLKDASAYNVQFMDGKPIFIDTLSFEIYDEGKPWQAYRQFCQHFLAPLALMAKKDVSLGLLLKVYVDGIPLDLACKLMPKKAFLNPGLFVHLFTHARMQKAFSQTKEDKPASKSQKLKITRKGAIGTLQFLRHTVQKLVWNPVGTEWSDYYQSNNYSDLSFTEKSKIVERYLQLTKPGVVWDLGANTGCFSRLARKTGAITIAFDLDPAAVELNYREQKKQKDGAILPLLLDLLNPSPAIGWANLERNSLIERARADCIMALALIHHLVISGNIPLERVAILFSQLSKELIIEFVPKTDSQVKRLLQSRQDIFIDYTQENFEQIFANYYSFASIDKIAGTERVLYYMVKK